MLVLRGMDVSAEFTKDFISAEGDIATEVNLFADVPWFRLRSTTGCMGHGSEVSGADAFHPACRYCQKARSVWKVRLPFILFVNHW